MKKKITIFEHYQKKKKNVILEVPVFVINLPGRNKLARPYFLFLIKYKH